MIGASTFHVSVGSQPESVLFPWPTSISRWNRRACTRRGWFWSACTSSRSETGVLRAYRERCAICRLRREELLDTAHILADGHPRGAPIVPNGLALCTLHHVRLTGTCWRCGRISRW